MSAKPSGRLLAIVAALPIQNGMRILEIGCGPGVAAREIVQRYDQCFVLAIDRSAKAIEQALKSAADVVKDKRLRLLQSDITDFKLPASEALFDLAFAIRVGALDGRHPEVEEVAFKNIAACLKPGGRLFIDGGEPLKEVLLDRDRSGA